MFKSKSQKSDEELIQRLYIAAPCKVDWNSMTGDERTRYCGQCKLSVYNIAEMSTKDAAAMIRKSEGRMCLKLFKRKDGTIITDNCPVGLRKMRNRMKKCAAGILLALAWAGFNSAARAQGFFQTEPAIEPGSQFGGASVCAPGSELVQVSTALKASSFVSAAGLIILTLLKRAKLPIVGSMLLAVWMMTGIIYVVSCGCSQSGMQITLEAAEHCNDLCLYYGFGTLFAFFFIESLLRRRASKG